MKKLFTLLPLLLCCACAEGEDAHDATLDNPLLRAQWEAERGIVREPGHGCDYPPIELHCDGNYYRCGEGLGGPSTYPDGRCPDAGADSGPQ